MPRKSIFRRNKNKVEKPEETTEESASLSNMSEQITSLKRSTESNTLDINNELYNEINSFGNALTDDGTFSLNADVDTTAFIYQPNEELLKPALKKKERKPRRKRGRKAKEELVKSEPVVEEESKEVAKEDIMAKLKAMEAERNAIIAPIKEELKPKPKSPTENAKKDIMARLKELEASRSIVIKPVEQPKQEALPKPTPPVVKKAEPIIVVKPKALSKDVNEKMIMSGKDYNIKFNTNNQTKSVTTILFSNDIKNMDLFRITCNNVNNQIELHQFGGKWRRITRLKLRNKDVRIKIKFNTTRIQYQIYGSSQASIKRADRTAINKSAWTMDNLSIV